MLRLPRNFKTCFKIVLTIYLVFSISSLLNTSTPFIESNRVDQDSEPVTGFQVRGSQLESLCPPFQSGRGFLERIIFIEPSGEQCLLPRDACGIESAARTNPNITIDVYFHTGSKLPVQVKLKTTLRKKIRSCAITDQLKSQYPHNVRFHREDLFLLLKDSRFRPMMDDPQWNTSAFSLIHFTDALKFVLLKKYGGMYLDTNFLTLRPLHCLNNSMTFVAPSVVGEGQQQLCNGVMALDKDHPFLGFAIRFMMTKYRPDRRGVLGGVSLGEAFHMFCGGKNITAGRHSCYKESQIELRVPKLFFPIQRKFIPILFSSNYRNRLDLNTDVLSDSFMTHIYGSQWGLPVNPKSLYATLAMNYCPTTWHVAQSSPETAGF